MKKILIYGMLLCVSLTLFSCMSSDSQEYKPRPENGDYVAVDRMVVKDLGNGAIDTLKVNYNRQLQPVEIVVRKNNSAESLPIPNIYEFNYNDQRKLNSIDVNKLNDSKYKWTAIYEQGRIVGFSNDFQTIDYKLNEKGSIINSIYGGSEFSYTYDTRGNLIEVIGDGLNLAISYTNSPNPFMNVNFNFFYFYVDGLELLALIQGAKFNMDFVTNKLTGDVWKFDYVYDDFGYVKAMKVVKDSNTLFDVSFKTSIYRVLE